ncbi:MAG: AmpG family muropeptide MFS transporter [Thioalkalispiraceae bacterium]|jgi:PAT family beta-lactamase induction signal transducer AmpG
MPESTTRTTSWKEAVTVYSKPRVIGMLFLGFSAGMPFLLVFSTLSAWLTEAGVSRAAIGFFSWVGITYSIKFFWAPVVDRLPLPLLSRLLGKRRSWMLLAMLGIAAGLSGMAFTDPSTHIISMAMFAVLVAFASATQDIVIDAYRIEAVVAKYQAAMAAMYILGYRLALLVTGAGALAMADQTSWTNTYLAMALLMLVGIITVLIIREPESSVNQDTIMREQRVVDFLERSAHLPVHLRNAMAWFIGAVVCPFTDFFQRNGAFAITILLFISLFRISDITMGVMANPFYLDLGFSKTQIAWVAKGFGFAMMLIGAASGGVMVARYGIMRPLLLGAILVSATNLLFAFLAKTGADLSFLIVVISADNFSGGLATAVFIAYLSSLTNTAYTATQYALFSSLMTLVPKFLGGFSGIIVEAQGYFFFFVYAALVGIPAILLVFYLMKHQKQQA